MIVDTRLLVHPAYRPHSVVGALAHVLDPVDVGENILIEAVLCPNGKPAADTVVRATISKLSDGRCFITRREGRGRRVYRIA